MKVKTCPCCKDKRPIDDFYGRGKAYKATYWCKGCYNTYKYNYVKERKRVFVRLLGDKCSKCGIEHNNKNTAIFDFHHKDESTKTGDWTKMRNRSLEKQRDEISKCILVCANCHRLIHAKSKKSRPAGI